MRAHCHRNEGKEEIRKYQNLRKGYPVQTTMARQLHAIVGVPEGPCGVEELEQFQRA